MPNHVKNIVMFDGEPEIVAKLMETIKGDPAEELACIDFNKIVPMPEDLREVSPGGSLSKKEEENYKKYGYYSWYDWSRANWGTKWNAYEQGYLGGNTITFWTAWSVPVKALVSLSAMFPEVTIEVEYADEDIGNNCGMLTIEHGEVVSRGDAGIEFACDVWGYAPEDVGFKYDEKSGTWVYDDTF